jgi:two-component system LytT family response regulator
MIKAIALDDEPPALEIIENFCSLTDYIDLVKKFTRDEEAMKYLANFPVDLLFLDINMPSISGLDFKKQVEEKTMVIFTTAYSEFAVEGFNLNAIDYLLKPFTPERFLQAAEKAKSQYRFLHQNALAKSEYISIRMGYALMKIALADIIFIEGLDDYLKIHLKGQKPVVSRMTMKAILEKLPQSDFVRVHRSYIVPLANIESVRNRVIFLRNNKEEIPLGSSYESRFYEVFDR